MSCVMQAKSAFLCVGGECFYNLIMANYGEKTCKTVLFRPK